MLTLNIWSPRPKEQSKSLINAFGKGIVVHSLPMIDIQFVQSPVTEIKALLDAHDSCLFISQNAVIALMSELDSTLLQGKKIFAIGEATQQKLLQNKITVNYTCKPPFTSESILDDEDFWAQNFERLLIVCGQGGRSAIKDGLVAKGKISTRLECYRRDKAQLSAKSMVDFIVGNEISAVVLTSVGVTEAVVSCLAQVADVVEWRRITVFAFSERIANVAKSLGFCEVYVSKSASQDELINLVTGWWENKKRDD